MRETFMTCSFFRSICKPASTKKYSRKLPILTHRKGSTGGGAEDPPPLARGHSIVVLVLDPVLHLNLLRLNLFLPQRIMVASTKEIDDVIGILKDRLSRSQRVFTNALELRVAVTAVG